MRHRSDEAYVLATQELGEADLIVTLLGESAGLVRGVAPSARKSRKRFGGALEPLTRVRAAWNEKQGRELHRIEALDLVRSYAAMQAEPARQAACAVLAEIFRAVAREDQPEPHGFRLLGAVLDAVEGGLDPFAAVRYAEYWTLRLHGVLSDPSACADCGAPLEEAGWASPVSGVLCPDCLRSRSVGARRLQPQDRAFLRAAAGSPPAAMQAHAAAARPGGALETLLRGGVESFVERTLRAYRHLLERSARQAAEP
ncbi:MAG TPA: DNA repair protein RecO [Candidatus Polarisedimenticolaceae bacterium]|nr:DNA repair protein RecO [Candidatus Polarisedimenticolaceae bacterium]